MVQRTIRTDPDSVRAEHGRMFRKLNRQLGIHKASLQENGWRLLTRAAFSLYLDSRPEQVPLFAQDQSPPEIVEYQRDRAEALPATR